jgi:hypothetical protein
MIRLQSVEPALWAKLCASSSDARRAAVLHACEFAVRTSGIENELVLDTFTRLVIGDEFTPDERDELFDIARQLDDQHHVLRDTVPEESARAFNQARAVCALAYAARQDTDENAAEAIYEAYCSQEHVDEILRHVHQALDKLQTFLS